MEATTSHTGFLFQTIDGRWVLSQEPNLKSCCVGSAAKAKTQIFLEGDFSGTPDNTLLTVRGELHTREGRQVLSHAEVVKSNTTHKPIYTLGLVGGALLLLLIGKKFFKPKA